MSQEPSVEATTPPVEPSPARWGNRSLLFMACSALIIALDILAGGALPLLITRIIALVALAGVVAGVVCAVIGIVRDRKKSNAVIAMVLYSLCIVLIILTLLGPVLAPPTEKPV